MFIVIEYAALSVANCCNFLLPEYGFMIANSTDHDETLKCLILVCAVSWCPSGPGKHEPRHEISNNVVCATSKASDQTAL